MSTNVEAVEFVGGPLDGFVQFVEFPLTELGCFATLPINRNVVEMSNGVRPGIEEPASSVAIYELTMMTSIPQYVHRGSVLPSRCELADWVG